MRRRAFVYITRDLPTGRELLVFTQEDPAAGVQTPGGTIEPYETVLEGALREAFEETGLRDFAEPRHMAVNVFIGPDEDVECFHIHLPFMGEGLDAWTHTVSDGQADKGMEFSCFWLSLEQARVQVWPYMVYALGELEQRLQSGA